MLCDNIHHFPFQAQHRRPDLAFFAPPCCFGHAMRNTIEHDLQLQARHDVVCYLLQQRELADTCPLRRDGVAVERQLSAHECCDRKEAQQVGGVPVAVEE